VRGGGAGGGGGGGAGSEVASLPELVASDAANRRSASSGVDRACWMGRLRDGWRRRDFVRPSSAPPRRVGAERASAVAMDGLGRRWRLGGPGVASVPGMVASALRVRVRVHPTMTVAELVGKVDSELGELLARQPYR
jgi:hypothetical protein